MILGNSGVGKSHRLYHEIIEQAVRYPDRHFFVIVPEQFTMQTQRDLVRMHPRGGVMNIDILSFQRLAYRIFDEVGGNQCLVLEEIGKSLVLQKIAEEKKEELSLLGGGIRKSGYIQEMKSVISEFTQYGVEAEELEELIAFSGRNARLQLKLRDIQVLYEAFCQYLKDRYITAEQLLEVLCRVVPKSALLKDSVLALDGFTGFTPVQNQLLEILLGTAAEVWITVTMDEKENIYYPGSEHQLFYLSRKTIWSLHQIAKRARVPVEKPIWLSNGKNYRFRNSPALAWLEKHLFRYDNKSYGKEQADIRLGAAADPLEESEAAAREIIRLVRTGGCRYQDIAVVTGDISIYGTYVEKIFADYGIPCFIDQKRNILMNPSVEAIRSLIQMVDTDYTYEAVFRFLRSGMSGYERRDVDLLENYVIALGIRGFSRWKKQWIRTYGDLREEELVRINGLRERIVQELMDVTASLKSRKSTVRQRTQALYHWMTERNIQQQLKNYEERFKADGRMDLAKEYSQVYRILMELFDKLVDLLGDEVLPLKEYGDILDAGFAEARVGVIPMGQDLVVVGDVERTRLKDIRVLFFLGVNDGIVPKHTGAGGILSDMDREFLEGSEIELAPTSKQNSYIQRFYLYLNMTKPQEKLYVSYSRTDASGAALRPSYLINNLHKMFPMLETKDLSGESLLASVVSPYSGISGLIRGLQDLETEEPSEDWKELYSWYFKQEAWKDKLDQLVDACFLSNSDRKISKAVANALYGTTLENSVTRLEQFASCACAHFLNYGLRLQEREEYAFADVDLGTIFHRALESFGKKLDKSGFTWFDLPEEERERMSDEAVGEVVTDYGNMILYSSARNTYLLTRMKRLLRRTTWALKEQLKRGDFKPGNYEVSFSNASSLESVNIVLSEEERLRLQGRIDRVDICEDEDKIYVKVVDYKSGNTSFDLVSLYYGLQLQLVVYLNAAMEIERKEHPDKEIIPAGILYYHIQDPMLDKKTEESPEAVQERILEKLKMTGLVNADREILERMDGNLDGKSPVIPVAVNKDGSLAKNSSVATGEQFRLISDYVNEMIGKLGKGMLSGNVEAAPYELAGRTGCDYCPYQPVCGYDPKVQGFGTRRLKNYPAGEILERMKGGDL